jgi:aspartyl-tRNA(Asn)/glutamyl-tRNA(Gln) amidotransferase subunit B
MIREPESDPLEIAMKLNLLQNSDADEIAAWVEEVLGSMPDKVAEYKKGKKGLIGLFVGEVKRISKGKADPALTNRLLLQKLDKRG